MHYFETEVKCLMCLEEQELYPAFILFVGSFEYSPNCVCAGSAWLLSHTSWLCLRRNL